MEREENKPPSRLRLDSRVRGVDVEAWPYFVRKGAAEIAISSMLPDI